MISQKFGIVNIYSAKKLSNLENMTLKIGFSVDKA